MWKSHVENSDLYSQDPPHPLAEETLQKPTYVSEHLRARLREQLAELRVRLWPGSAGDTAAAARHSHAIRAALAPLTEQLQSALTTNVHNLCQALRQHLQELQQQSAVPASRHQGQQATPASYLPQIGRSLEDSVHRMTSSVLEFRAGSAAAAQRLQEAGQREGLLEVANRIAQEAATLEQEFRNRVGALKESLGSLLLSNNRGGAGGDVSSSAARFCQQTRAIVQQFSGDMEGQFSQLTGGQEEGMMEQMPPLREDFLREDFTSRMHTLLQEIMQTLN